VTSQTIQIRGTTARKLIGIFLISILVTLSVRTIVRNFDWKDNLTLFSHDLKIAKDPYDLDYALAVELGKREQYDEAILHLTNLTKSPRHIWPNWYYIGLFYEKKGDIQKAKKSIAKAIEESKKTTLGPLDLVYEKMAILKLRSEDAQSTKIFAQEALQRLPKNPKLWLVVALAEYKLGNTKLALEAARKSFELLPDEESFYVLSQLERNFPIEF
jgi:tetratricopeptide (TPR) repeat protein